MQIVNNWSAAKSMELGFIVQLNAIIDGDIIGNEHQLLNFLASIFHRQQIKQLQVKPQNTIPT